MTDSDSEFDDGLDEVLLEMMEEIERRPKAPSREDTVVLGTTKLLPSDTQVSKSHSNIGKSVGSRRISGGLKATSSTPKVSLVTKTQKQGVLTPKTALEFSDKGGPSASRPTSSSSPVQTSLTRNYKVVNNSWVYTSNNELRTDKTPTHHELDPEMLSIYIYPTNLEVRKYQMQIVNRALFENVLCALPTGLGKTFIASTVMLNFYRWTKKGKVIFMAPTRPLVSQQLEACLGITGIPRSDSSILIGGVMAPRLREMEWRDKRVFFATPQTVESDLKKGWLDPKDVACLVVDEAHRASGNQSYVEVVRFLNRFNKSFRVLALTATPSSTFEGVQSIITNLNISHVEIRTEDSEDIKPYMHKKEINRMVSMLSGDIQTVMDLFSQTYQSILNDLAKSNVFHCNDPTNLNQFLVVSKIQNLMGPQSKFKGSPVVFKYVAQLKSLASMGHAIGLLKFHGIRPFYNYMQSYENGLIQGPEDDGDDFVGKKKKKKPGKYAGIITQHESWRKCMEFCESLLFDKEGNVNDKFIGHPKLENLVNIAREFFINAWALDKKDSKAIIFSAYRDSGQEIIRTLKEMVPECRPHMFIGQAGATTKSNDSGKKSKGMTQKEQQKVVEQFKNGAINALVATSIGEEGLDIGEVDLIICYDASSSPIQMLQRMGRTGRKREGQVYMLLTESEEKKLDRSIDNYQYIQNLIKTRGENHGKYGGIGLEFAMKQRMIPPEINPECVEMKIDIPEENKQVLAAKDILKEVENTQKDSYKSRKSRGKEKASKKKFHMPDNVITGFINVSTGKEYKENKPLSPLSSVPDNTTLSTASQKSPPERSPPRKKQKQQEMRLLVTSDSDSDDDISQLVAVPTPPRSVQKSPTGLRYNSKVDGPDFGIYTEDPCRKIPRRRNVKRITSSTRNLDSLNAKLDSVCAENYAQLQNTFEAMGGTTSELMQTGDLKQRSRKRKSSVLIQEDGEKEELKLSVLEDEEDIRAKSRSSTVSSSDSPIKRKKRESNVSLMNLFSSDEDN